MIMAVVNSQSHASNCKCEWCFDDLQAENEKLKKARKALKAAGMTLDAISAENMRHVLDGVKDIVSEALKEPE